MRELIIEIKYSVEWRMRIISKNKIKIDFKKLNFKINKQGK